MSDTLPAAYFVEGEWLHEPHANIRKKTYTLKMDIISFECFENIPFEIVKEQCLMTAKALLDKAPCLSQDEVQRICVERYNRLKMKRDLE